ncbi:hypothetical protein F4823DRAFT_580528 [Ustulina deusta]|nr:hypothetical protein F4823DRAFT_580528 [Ustulina deusta]
MAVRVDRLKRQAFQRPVNQAHRKGEGESKPRNQLVLPTLEDVVLTTPEEAESVLQQAEDACSSFPFPRLRGTICAWRPEGPEDWQFIATEAQSDKRDGKLVSNIDEYLAPLYTIHELSLARSPVALSPRDQQRVVEFYNEYQLIPYGLLRKIGSPVTSATGASTLQEFYLSSNERAIEKGIAKFFGRDITLDDIMGSCQDVIERLVGLRRARLALEAPNLQDSEAELYRAQPTDIISFLVINALLKSQTPDWSSWDEGVKKLTECFGVAEPLQPYWVNAPR